MEILFRKQSMEFLQFLPHIKAKLKEWLFVEIKLTQESDEDFTITDAAMMVLPLFKDKEGTIYICNSREMLMLVKLEIPTPPAEVAKHVEKHLPPGSCEAHAYEPTPEGLKKLAIIVSYKKPVVMSSFAIIRKTRKANIVFVADDDMFMRMLVKKALGPLKPVIHEAADGNDVLAGYIDCVPDMLLLDIHLPNVSGNDLLRNILTVDPEAFIIMMSADSSVENVKLASSQGAKGFLAKPLVKDKLLEYVRKCSTIS